MTTVKKSRDQKRVMSHQSSVLYNRTKIRKTKSNVLIRLGFVIKGGDKVNKQLKAINALPPPIFERT